MKRESWLIRAVCAGFVSSVVFGCAPRTPVIQPPLPSRADEVASFKPVVPEVWKLANGLEVIYLPDDELPLVRGRLFMRGGSLWTPTAPNGAVVAMGEQMRSGGIAALSADDLDKELEKLAAGIITSFGAEFGSAAFSCLASDFDTVFKIFSEVLLSPRFESDKLALWKGQALEGIRRRKEDAATVAGTAFNQILYKGTPYGQVTLSSDVAKITRTELQRLHKELVKPDGAVLVITGRVSKGEIADTVERFLGGWKSRGTPLPPPPAVDNEPKPAIYFVELPFSQATIYAGQLGVPRLTPDAPAIEVFNEVFGSSGFGSRLMQRVRTDRGLTYSIFGGIAPGTVKGSNYIVAQTKAESVGEALTESVQVLKELQQVAVPESDLVERKVGIKNSFVFNFESADNVAGRLAKLRLLGYPEDYDATYLPRIEAVSPKDVMEVANNRWNPEKFAVVIVGNETAYQRVLALKASQSETSAAKILRGFEVVKLGFDQALQFE